LLLARMKVGGARAGQEVRTGEALIVSEESHEDWEGRSQHLGLTGHVCVISRPFRTVPSQADWQQLLDYIAELHQKSRFDLLVIDPLASLLPGNCESHAKPMLAAILPLRDLCASCRLAGLLLHHPRKKESKAGQRSRGTGALSGVADILLELEYVSSPEESDRRRLLLGWSRQSATPRRQVIELNPAGTDYHSLGDLEEMVYARAWPALATILSDATEKMTREQIQSAWTTDSVVGLGIPTPSGMTFYRWLERAVEEKRVNRQGTGHKGEPFRYWLPGQEAKWDEENPLWRHAEDGEQVLRQLEEDWRRIRQGRRK
jgi:hypothetical protein